MFYGRLKKLKGAKLAQVMCYSISNIVIFSMHGYDELDFRHHLPLNIEAP